MLSKKFTAIENDYNIAQEALKEQKKVCLKLEGVIVQENTQKQQLSVKLENETLNNKKLLRELNKANQTISQLRSHLEKQTTRVVDQAKNAK